MKIAVILAAAAAVLVNPIVHAADPALDADPQPSAQLRLSMPFGDGGVQPLRLGLAWQHPSDVTQGLRPFPSMSLETSLTGPQRFWINGQPVQPDLMAANDAAGTVSTGIIVVGVIAVVALVLVFSHSNSNGNGSGY